MLKCGAAPEPGLFVEPAEPDGYFYHIPGQFNINEGAMRLMAPDPLEVGGVQRVSYTEKLARRYNYDLLTTVYLAGKTF